jgi:hypothetical protein
VPRKSINPTPSRGKLLQQHAGVFKPLKAARNGLMCQPPLTITTAGSAAGHDVG